MSEADPRGYYACLGVKPWATAADIRTAYHRCAKKCHPDVDPRPEAKARFQAINEAYRILINPLERAIYDRSAGATRPQSYATSLRTVFIRAAEVARPWFTQGKRRIAALLLVGVFGLVAVLLGDFRGIEESPLFPRLSATSPTVDAGRPSEELALTSIPVHQPGGAVSSRSLHASAAPVPPPTAKNTTSPVSGAWLLGDLPNQKPPINLLTREEAQRAQRRLVDRGYLLGRADGIWSLRSQAAFLDFRRAQGLSSDDAWTSERQSASASQNAAPPGLLEERVGAVGHVSPPDQPTDLPDGIASKEANDSVDEIANVTPTARASGEAQPLGAGESYVGAWARSRAACVNSEVPPLAISAQRASSFGGHAGECEFKQIRREGDGWRTSARCIADGKAWTANVHLRATASTLIWSSERGRATYYRCG